MHFEYDPIKFSQYARFCNCSSSDCHCGENNVCEWTWDTENATSSVDLSEQNLEIQFHNGYSGGTAVTRSNKLLEKNKLHYWEIKMLTPACGTDIMVGVGTNKVNFDKAKRDFCSFLGLDQESFGFSYRGYIQHNGKKHSYGACFGEGSLVGVYLDTWRGTLEFFLNRKPLGIAFSGLQNIMLYPMLSSTTALSKMRLTCSCSIPASLQVECLSALKTSQITYLSTIPGTRYLTQSIFADILKPPLDDDGNDDGNDDEHGKEALDFVRDYMIFDDFDYALVGISKTKKK